MADPSGKRGAGAKKAAKKTAKKATRGKPVVKPVREPKNMYDVVAGGSFASGTRAGRKREVAAAKTRARRTLARKSASVAAKRTAKRFLSGKPVK